MYKPLSILLLLVASASAHAEWLEASSDHFVVYGDTNERNLRRFAEQLERFDGAMRAVSGIAPSKPTPSVRLTVYLTGREHTLRSLAAQNGRSARYIAGFYIPSIEGPVAFVSTASAAREGDADIDTSMLWLLHEYAHHFRYMNSRFPAPRWLSEGSAEFFASASFEVDGSVVLGRPANHRTFELMRAPDVTVIDLVDEAHYAKRAGANRGYDAYYGRAWLLYHYLTFEPSRKGQLSRYIQGLAEGRSSRESAEAAFGDLEALDKDIGRYMGRSNFSVYKVKADLIPTGDIRVRRLTPGEAAIMPVVMRSKRGVASPELAEEIVREARAVAARFPMDAAVLAALAEAEGDTLDNAATLAAAERALRIDPRNVDALTHKAFALFHRARLAGDPNAMGDAQDALIALNAVETDHPVPLLYFYLSHTAVGLRPSANAIAGLEKAVRIAPFSYQASMALAHQRLLDGRIDDVRDLVLPVALNPHGGKRAERLRGWLAKLDTATPADTAALAAELRTMTQSGAGGAAESAPKDD
jgi:tetratricopeptide (TPR) repeat protein